ncbi:MAG: ParB/RepB/Spo0J family partition protein [Paracoccaceae bacterium]
MSRKSERKGLGRGLSALLADVDLAPDNAAPPVADSPAPLHAESVVAIERLRPNPDQPRRDFAEGELADLTASINERGIIQPLIVRPDPAHRGDYQIVAGERRWRAAQRARLHELPVLVREFDDTEVLEIAIIENIQRSDLNPIEEASGFRQLMDRFGHTQEKLAAALGKSRSHIANLLRLLNLPEPVQAMIREGKLTAGHARTLVTAADPLALAREIVGKGLSVRQAERLARAQAAGGAPKRRPRPEKDADTRSLEAALRANLGLKVSIAHRPGGQAGEVRISYKTLEELDGLVQLLSQ